MKKILFALSMLAFAVSALPQARGADVSMDFIYDNLSGGNWIDAEGYGYGWQPDVAVSDPNWRPYSDGYWAVHRLRVDVDQLRGFRLGHVSLRSLGQSRGLRLGLVSRREIWIGDRPGCHGEPVAITSAGRLCLRAGRALFMKDSPSAGTWTSTFDIGPEYYNFCDVRFIGEPVLRDRIFPPVQNVTYITNTVNVTNIYVQNNMVYNYGPDYTVVNRYSSRPIQRLAIERADGDESNDRNEVGNAHEGAGKQTPGRRSSEARESSACGETASGEGEGCTAKDRAWLEGRA